MSTREARLPSVSEILGMDVVKFALPTVVSGAAGVTRSVRWVHVGEISDIADYLSGGELVLTTGVALPQDDRGLCRYLADLDDAGAAGLVVGLGRRFSRGDLPASLRSTADRREFPLVVLKRDTPFVQFSAAVNRLIVYSQVEELQASDAIYRTFAEIAVEGTTPAEIVRHAATMARHPVVLETLTHRVLEYDAAGVDAGLVVDDWSRRSRMARVAGRTSFDEVNNWLVTVVGARGQDWGRLILLTDGQPSARDVMVAERAASALAMDRLLAREPGTLEMQAHRSLITELRNHAHPVDEIARRARALGMPMRGRRLLGVAIRTVSADDRPGSTGTAMEVAVAAFQALTACGVPGLAGAVSNELTDVLLSIGAREPENALMEKFSTVLGRSHSDLLIGVGSCVTDLADARRSLMEAERVAEAASYAPDERSYYRLPDVRLRGLLHLLREDARLQTFAERELGALIAYDQRHDTRLLDALALYLEHGRNKSAAADASFMARSSFYDRLDKIEKILRLNLQSVETCLSLHVAVMAHRVMGS